MSKESEYLHHKKVPSDARKRYQIDTSKLKSEAWVALGREYNAKKQIREHEEKDEKMRTKKLSNKQ